MLHEPVEPTRKDLAGNYKMRLGIWMFALYTVIYAGFVVINLVAPKLMGAIILGGLNLATVYGFALIIIALIEALIYDAMCHKKEEDMEKAELLKDPSHQKTEGSK